MPKICIIRKKVQLKVVQSLIYWLFCNSRQNRFLIDKWHLSIIDKTGLIDKKIEKINFSPISSSLQDDRVRKVSLAQFIVEWAKNVKTYMYTPNKKKKKKKKRKKLGTIKNFLFTNHSDISFNVSISEFGTRFETGPFSKYWHNWECIFYVQVVSLLFFCHQPPQTFPSISFPSEYFLCQFLTKDLLNTHSHMQFALIHLFCWVSNLNIRKNQ